MGKKRARSPEEKELRRAAILQAAAALVEREGLEKTGLNAIAREAGISKANIYRYFESREAILLHLVLEDCRDWVGAPRSSRPAPTRFPNPWDHERHVPADRSIRRPATSRTG